MTSQEMLRAQTSVKERSGRFSTASGDELTISRQFIQQVSLPYYYYGPVGVPMPDWPITAGETQCDWIPFVEKQLNAIASLPDGWDSHGAPRPDARLVESARGLIRCLAEVDDLPQPHVNPTPAGGVQFEWEAGQRYFEIEIVGERAAEYLYCDDAAHVEETGNLFEGELLEQVIAYIRNVGSFQ